MADLTQFKQAMEKVYGPFPTSSINNTDHSTTNNNVAAKDWTPPARSGGHRGRYLWTDAFGVINFITLSKETQDTIYLTHARHLVESVHSILGRTRDGTARLPGASDNNPLGGGLRIGKVDESGSDGDGQYHHYLTLWMFALNRLAKATGDWSYNDQALKLAKAIHPRFFLGKGTERPRMVWKIKTDMSSPLVCSQGNLDPIGGFVVFRLLQAACRDDPSILSEEVQDYKRILDLKGKHTVHSDPLDLGMTLWTAQWLAHNSPWFQSLIQQASRQAVNVFEGGFLDLPTERRLAFREFGSCLGISCVDGADGRLLKYRERILEAWESDDDGDAPEELRAISEVMRAAAIIPGAFRRGYLGEEPEI